MPAVCMLVPFVAGMEGKGFHSYEEAEEERVPFIFPDSLISLSSDEVSQSDAASENED